MIKINFTLKDPPVFGTGDLEDGDIHDVLDHRENLTLFGRDTEVCYLTKLNKQSGRQTDRHSSNLY